MKVCMIAYTFYEVDSRLQQYTAALIERGDTVDVIALRQDGLPKCEVIEGVNVYRIQSRNLNERNAFDYASRVTRFLLRSAVIVTRKHLADPYQLVHVHSVPDLLVFSAVVPKLFGAAVILDIHDLLPEFFASKFGIDHESAWFKLMVSIERWSAAFADHLVVANDLWRERLSSRSVSEQKCTAIRNYPPLGLFRSSTKQKNNGKFLITYPGSLNRHQGLEVAINAFSRVADRMPEAEFHIYGEGPDKARLIGITKERHLENRIYFHNLIPRQEVASVMVNTDLAVEPKLAGSPFSNEAASTKILEFMAAGVPVIASRTAVHARYYDDSVLQFYNSDNEIELAECIFALWSDPGLRQRLVRCANIYVQQNNWEAKKKDYLNLVDGVITRRSAGASVLAN